MKNLIFTLLLFGLFSISAFAQKTIYVKFPAGENVTAVKATGTTIFVVKMRKGQHFEASAQIQSNKSKMSGILYTKINGQMDDNSVQVGAGTFENQWGGMVSETDTYFFKITELKTAKFIFRIMIK